MTSNGAHSEMTSPSPPVASENADNVATASPQTVVIKGRRYRQRQLGPAPFASFEDLSDELDSPPETARVPLPGIKEDPSSQLQSPSTPLPQVKDVNLTEKEEQCLKDSLTSSLDAPVPPRIDISRASSSSQHEDSLTSSPERENGTHNLGYKEDGTVDLRSSTEELDYIQEPGTVQESEEKRKREKMMKRQQQVRDFGETQSQHEFMERKDSNCSVMSDVGLLCISGRTSRLSSIGSAASGGSVASGTSHLSAGSHLSGRSTRSPSPHKMLLETSFCGSKPVHSQGVEPEISPATVEKSASRPPSRLRSRSPSPHKMLLETSFCGTKQIPPKEIEVSKEYLKKDKVAVSLTTVVTEAEIVQQKVSKPEASPKPPPAKEQKEKEKKVEKVDKPKPHKSDQSKQGESKVIPSGTKPYALPKKTVTKPRKIISLRDIPGDEIFIPLKGPEVDFEEIIRKGSPHVQKKTEQPTSSADEIFIPLHSPPKSPTEKETRITQQDTSYSLPKTCKTKDSNKPSSQKVPEKKLGEKQQRVKQEPKKRQYEVCEDGSIFIPLHSPDEEKTSNNFEDEIKRVDQELQKAREAAERRLKDEEDEKQRKPATLDLVDSGSHKSRLSQSYPSGKSEIPSGGSRTPSPGSTLSRKSSFASLFRKSDVFSSPESQSSSTVRKKSGTLTNMLKEASDGLRERSRSRSKSKERQSQSSSSARSPSGKKNVFTNLFAKKKTDIKVVSGKENEQLPSRLDLQFTFPAGTEHSKTFDEGDYIIIPLRDPSDPPDSLDVESEQEFPGSDKTESRVERSSSPLFIVEKSESPRTVKKSRDTQEESVETYKTKKSSSKDSISSGRKIETDVIYTKRLSSSESKPGILSPKEGLKTEYKAQTKSLIKQSSGDDADIVKESVQGKLSTSKSPESSYFDVKESVQNGNLPDENDVDSRRLQHDSSIEIEEKSPKEEILTVTDSGVRKLKLPPEPGDLEDDHERKGLVYQESFEDELPYVPTTLPLERPIGVQIVPIKHRVNEIKTCSIERPRSTTPINPTCLEDFISSKETAAVSAEKMKISLPRDNSITSKSKSPTRYGGKGKTWFEFAEAVLQSPRDGRKSSLRTTPSPPPLPPRSSPPSVLSSSAPPTTTSWINFEELPEKRKLPKKITVVPTLRSSADGKEKSSGSVGGGVVYSYVSPEDCQCECHDHNASHSKESDHERGQKNDLSVELKSNGEFVKKGFLSKSKVNKPQKEKEKSGCEDCESGIHETGEIDIEETPLLDVNSDEEEDCFLGKASSATKPGMKFDNRKASHLSDSSGECVSQEALIQAEQNDDENDSRPFGMDLEVGSSRSSVLSQVGINILKMLGRHQKTVHPQFAPTKAGGKTRKGKSWCNGLRMKSPVFAQIPKRLTCDHWRD